MDAIDTERLLDSEYFIDLLGFSYPADWARLAVSTANGYRGNAASLDCCDLLLSQHFLARRDLPGRFYVQFRYMQDEDKEKQNLRHNLEVGWRPGGGLTLMAFGEPAFNKEDADIGLGLAYARDGWLKLEARHFFVDFSFNRRGETSESYPVKPQTELMTAELSAGADRFTAALELDSPLRRLDETRQRLFSYRRTHAAAAWRRERPGAFSPRLEYSYEFRTRSDDFVSAANPSLDARLHAHRALAAVDGPLGARDSLEAGAALVSRSHWTGVPGSGLEGRAEHRLEAQPYGRWRRAFNPRLTGDFSAFFSAGRRHDRTLWEAKLGAGLEFNFSPQSRLGLQAMFDLDEFGSHPWDGGGARALFLF